MAIPVITALKLWAGTLFTKDDWDFNFSQIVSWLGDGSSDLVVNTIKTTNGIDLDGANIINVGAATSGSQAINLDQANTILNRSSYYYPFSVASGKVDSNGDAAYLQKDSDSQLTVLAGNVNPDLVCVSSDGTIESVTSNVVLTVPGSDGTYHIVKEKGQAISITSSSTGKITVGKLGTEPVGNIGDYYVNTATIPFVGKKYTSNGWEATEFCWLGDVTVESGTATINQFPYNDNYFDVNRNNQAIIIETYVSGNDWYRVYSDGWCEQGGRAFYDNSIGSGTNKNTSVTFLKNFADLNYSFMVTSNRTNCYAFEDIGTPYDYTSGRSVSGTYVGFRNVNNDTSSTGKHGACWIAKGYLAADQY